MDPLESERRVIEAAEARARSVAATADAGPLIAMAAAGDHGRGLIAPCGRCRQAMLDLHPDIRVAIPSEHGPRMRPIRKLLPGAYESPDGNALRVLRFNKHSYDSAIDGSKVSTIRWDESPRIGRAIFVFDDKYDHRPVLGTITRIGRHPLSELTPQNANLAADTDMAGYIKGLRSHYPEMPPEAEVDVVTFQIEARPA